MKRTIKFRGKREDNGEWVEGGYFGVDEDGDALHTFILTNCQTRDFTSEHSVFTGHKVDKKTVGQFTGLKDKNGVEIYEGDVVRYETDCDLLHFEVKWNKDTLMWEAASQLIVDEPLYYKERFIEIVGNIHDNSELMEAI